MATFGRRAWAVGVGLIALSLGTGSSPQAGPLTALQVATIKGRVKFSGETPPNPPIDMTSEPACKARYAAAPRDDVVLVSRAGGLANVLVYVKAGLPRESSYPAPTTAVVLGQSGCMYQPRVFGVMIGQPLEIENNDTLLHNVKTLGRMNRRFDINQPGMTMTRSVIQRPLAGLTNVVVAFTVPEVGVPFECSLHPWMRAYAGVFPHPFFAVTGEDGSFTLSGMPPGTYTIGTWHEGYGAKETTVTVGAGETKTIEVGYSGA